MNKFIIFFIGILMVFATMNSNQAIPVIDVHEQYTLDSMATMDSLKTEIRKNFKKPHLIDSTELEDIIKVVAEYTFKNVKKTEVTFAQALVDMKIFYPDIAYKSSMTEGFNSKLARKGNNLFGMKIPGRRTYCSLKKKYLGHATYAHWIYSVADYKLFQLSKKESTMSSRKSWIKNLNNGYNVSKTYGSRLDRMSLPDNIKEIFLIFR